MLYQLNYIHHILGLQMYGLFSEYQKLFAGARGNPYRILMVPSFTTLWPPSVVT